MHVLCKCNHTFHFFVSEESPDRGEKGQNFFIIKINTRENVKYLEMYIMEPYEARNTGQN